MPLLVKLGFIHCGPKDSESGIQTYLIANSIDEVIKYVDKEYLSDRIAESRGSEEDSASVSYGLDYFKDNPAELQRAIDLGLNVEDVDIGYVTGSYHAVTEFYGGTDWDEDADAYYGTTDYNWRESRPISEDQISVLIDLEVAIDIRQKEIAESTGEQSNPDPVLWVTFDDEYYKDREQWTGKWTKE